MCALFALCGVYFNAQAFPGRQHSVESCALRDAENCSTAQITGTATTKIRAMIRARTNVANGKDNAFMSRTHGHKRL
jgi:hypothetical protein